MVTLVFFIKTYLLICTNLLTETDFYFITNSLRDSLVIFSTFLFGQKHPSSLLFKTNSLRVTLVIFIKTYLWWGIEFTKTIAIHYRTVLIHKLRELFVVRSSIFTCATTSFAVDLALATW